MENCNTILTGVPRSGTTLTCWLLNKLPDTVALHEPMNVFEWKVLQSHETICNDVGAFFREMRESLLRNGTAMSKHVGGRVPDNPTGDTYSVPLPTRADRLLDRLNNGDRAQARLRKSQATKGIIAFEKPLSHNFLLCIKHPSAFTAILTSLHRRYPCYALIRNPLPVLASWNSVNYPVWNGHVPAAECRDLALALKLAQISDRFERQLYILSWFFDRYQRTLPDENILRYEDIIASGGAALKVITPKAGQLNVKLENKDKNKLYNGELMQAIGKELLKTEGAFWEFYSKDSVEMLLQEST